MRAMVRRSGVIYGALFLVFSIILTFGTVSHNPSAISASSFSIFLYEFGINSFGSFSWIQGLKNQGILESSKLLFPNQNGFTLPLGWFLNTGFYTLFLDIPPVVLYFYFNRNFETLILQMIWGLSCIFLGFLFGSSLSVLAGLSRKGGNIGSGFLNALKLFSLTSVFILFDLTIFYPSYIGIFDFALKYPLDFIFPVLNMKFIAFQPHVNFDSLVASFSWTLFYLLISLYASYFISNKILDNIFEGHGTVNKKKKKSGSVKYRGIILSLISKDLKIATRDFNNISTFFIPVFFSLPALLEVFVNRRFGSFPPIYTYVSIFVLTSVSVSFYAIQSLVMEGKSFINMRIWRISNRDLILSKTLSSLIIFLFFAIPVAIIMIGANMNDLPYLILISIDAALAFLFSSILTIYFMISKIPDDAVNINIYSFGGTLGIIVIFLISALSGALSPIGSYIIGAFLAISPIDFPSVFLGMVLVLSLILTRIGFILLSEKNN